LQRRSNGAFCLSEPEAGSDATSQKTTAIDKGDHYLLNGTKIGLQMDPRRTLSLRKRILKGHKGINAFIVEKGGLV
jgi:alkylation response protein AidB-like acyl-CoA dehydrogenase